MTNQSYVLHLNGFPGTGKLTVAKALAKDGDIRLIDNHMLNNPIFTLVRENSVDPIPEEAWVAIRAIRKLVLDGLTTIAKPHISFVITNCLGHEDQEDYAIYEGVRDAVTKSGRAYIPVLLSCSEEENLKRIMDEGREANMKMRDTKGLEKLRGEFTLAGKDHPNALHLDITTLQPHEAAKSIRDHVHKVLTV
jgi:deoxyadenosine/deoxycytidine kinase